MSKTANNDKTIAQVCIIVADVEKSADIWRQVFNWGISEEVEITHPHEHTKATYYGEPTDARAKIVHCGIGDIHFEMLQPLEPPSSWQDFLDQRSEGIHHVAFFVPDTAAALEPYLAEGYQVVHQGLFTGQGGMYTYLDTDKDMGIVIELLEAFGNTRLPPAPLFDRSTGIGTDVICQVGVIVNDVLATSARISAVLGQAQPPIIQTPGYDLAKTMYRGAPSEATAKLAFFDFGQVQIELIEPDEEPSVWRDYLNAKGEGPQHIAFQIDNTRTVTDYLAGHGIDVIQQGLYADGSGMYTYLDSDNLLGTTIELLENFS